MAGTWTDLGTVSIGSIGTRRVTSRVDSGFTYITESWSFDDNLEEIYKFGTLTIRWATMQGGFTTTDIKVDGVKVGSIAEIATSSRGESGTVTYNLNNVEGSVIQCVYKVLSLTDYTLGMTTVEAQHYEESVEPTEGGNMKIGNNNILAAYVGNTKANKIYLGDKLIFGQDTPPVEEGGIVFNGNDMTIKKGTRIASKVGTHTTYVVPVDITIASVMAETHETIVTPTEGGEARTTYYAPSRWALSSDTFPNTRGDNTNSYLGNGSAALGIDYCIQGQDSSGSSAIVQDYKGPYDYYYKLGYGGDGKNIQLSNLVIGKKYKRTVNMSQLPSSLNYYKNDSSSATRYSGYKMVVSVTSSNCEILQGAEYVLDRTSTYSSSGSYTLEFIAKNTTANFYVSKKKYYKDGTEATNNTLLVNSQYYSTVGSSYVYDNTAGQEYYISCTRNEGSDENPSLYLTSNQDPDKESNIAKIVFDEEGNLTLTEDLSGHLVDEERGQVISVDPTTDTFTINASEYNKQKEEYLPEMESDVVLSLVDHVVGQFRRYSDAEGMSDLNLSYNKDLNTVNAVKKMEVKSSKATYLSLYGSNSTRVQLRASTWTNIETVINRTSYNYDYQDASYTYTTSTGTTATSWSSGATIETRIYFTDDINHAFYQNPIHKLTPDAIAYGGNKQITDFYFIDGTGNKLDTSDDLVAEYFTVGTTNITQNKDIPVGVLPVGCGIYIKFKYTGSFTSSYNRLFAGRLTSCLTVTDISYGIRRVEYMRQSLYISTQTVTSYPISLAPLGYINCPMSLDEDGNKIVTPTSITSEPLYYNE